MTENKRFSIRSYDGINCHIFDRSIVIAEVDRRDINNLCNLLNELSDENEELKQENERLSRLNEVKREQIKFHVDGYNQLKQTIEEALANERTSIGQSVLKQLLEAIQ